MRHVLLAAAALVSLAPPAVAADPSGPSVPLLTAVANTQRSEANRARDKYRHPIETLGFFGVKPTQTVVEYSPGGGWYSEILAPLLKAQGHYVALVPSKAEPKAKAYYAANAGWFGPVTVATLDGATGASTVPAGSADVVLTFRNVHNLLMGEDGSAAATFKAFYAALKPGGTLGVVDHRLPEAMDGAKEKSSGYVKRSTIVRLATAAGFKLAGESEINANPKDTHDWEKGVWTLPPTLTLGDTDRAKYLAIGESDRLTLRFVKPGR